MRTSEKSRLARQHVRLIGLLCTVVVASTSAPIHAAPPPDAVTDAKARLAQLETVLRAIPRDGFDLDAAVAKIGKNPDDLFRFIRDRTRLVAYRGSLRGPVGVLVDKTGNSLDRALLLGRLIEIAGGKVRLAHGTLDDAAFAVASRAADRRPVSVPEAPAPNAPRMSEADEREAAAMRAEAESTGVEVQRQSSADAELLIGAISVPPRPANAASALRDHWWVQLAKGGAWLDLDPTRADAEPGQGLIAPVESLEIAKLPPELFHEVDLRIVVESWRAGKLAEKLALAHTYRPGDLVGRSLFFVHAELGAGPAATAQTPALVRKALLEQRQWVPGLSGADGDYFGLAFDDRGSVGELKPASVNAAADATSALGGLVNQDPVTKSAPPEQESILTAEFLEVVEREPGRSPRVSRRPVFDLIGAAARRNGLAKAPRLSERQRLARALSLAGTTDLLILGAQPSENLVATLASKQLFAVGDVFLRGKTEMSPQDAVAKAAETIPRVPHALYALALSRAAWGSVGKDLYIDRTNVLTMKRLFFLGRKTDDIETCEGFDIVLNEVAPYPGVNDPFVARLRQGVFDTNAEHALAPSCKGENTAELYGRGLPETWVTLRARSDAKFSELQLPASTISLIEAELAAGQIIVAPTRSVMVRGAPRSAYWRVDPVTGTTLGMDSQGRGAELTEYQQVLVRLAGRAAAYVGCLVLAKVRIGMNPPTNRLQIANSAFQVAMCVGGAAMGYMGDAGGFVYGLSSTARTFWSVGGSVLSAIGSGWNIFYAFANRNPADDDGGDSSPWTPNQP